MRTFVDSLGRSFAVELTIQNVRDAKAVGVDIVGGINKGDLILDLWNDPIFLADTLLAFVSPKLESADFCRGLMGDSLVAGRDAILGAIGDWLPTERGAAWRKACEAIPALIAAHEKVARAKYEQAMEKLANG